MRVQQSLWTDDRGWNGDWSESADLLLAFGGSRTVTNKALWHSLSERAPSAIVLGCSTAGEIHGANVLDNSLSVMALSFKKTRLRAVQVNVEKPDHSFSAGNRLGTKLRAKNLRTIFLLSDGVAVNGSELVRGIRGAVDSNVAIAGGLAGDGPRFGTTYVGLNQVPLPGNVAAIGFYGTALNVGHGSAGGWDEFGPEHTITSSCGNVLLTLDGQPAWETYKKFLGTYIDELPHSALLFPLRICPPGRHDETLMRAVVGIDYLKKALILAGDIPRGYRAQLMRGHMGRLFEGAASAAQQANQSCRGESAAILVSCVGRKLVLGPRVAEEIAAVQNVLGDNTAIAGFYSYGGVAPHEVTRETKLHNQTMTVTVLSERDAA